MTELSRESRLPTREEAAAAVLSGSYDGQGWASHYLAALTALEERDAALEAARAEIARLTDRHGPDQRIEVM